MVKDGVRRSQEGGRVLGTFTDNIVYNEIFAEVATEDLPPPTPPRRRPQQLPPRQMQQP